MFIKLFRIGNEPELRHIPSGKAVCELSLAYDVGYGQNKKTQWIKAALWGERAEKLLPYLNKGDQLHAALDDVHIETWSKQDGSEGSTLKARVVEVSLVSNGGVVNSKAQSGQQQASAQQQAQQQASAANSNDSFDDDIPFR